MTHLADSFVMQPSAVRESKLRYFWPNTSLTNLRRLPMRRLPLRARQLVTPVHASSKNQSAAVINEAVGFWKHCCQRNMMKLLFCGVEAAETWDLHAQGESRRGSVVMPVTL